MRRDFWIQWRGYLVAIPNLAALLLWFAPLSAPLFAATTHGMASPEARAYGVDPMPRYFLRQVTPQGGSAPFVFRAKGYQAVVRAEGIRVAPAASGPGAAHEAGTWELRWLGARTDVGALPEEPGPVLHFWEAGTSGPNARSAQAQAQVRYAGIYPQTTLVYHANEGRLEYSFVLHPGADPQHPRFEVFAGANLALDDAGDIVAPEFPGGLRIRHPESWQVIDGERRMVSSRFVALGGSRFGFLLGDYDPTVELVIDPVVERSFLFGSDGDMVPESLQRDAAGNVYLIGRADHAPLPMEGANRDPVAWVGGITEIRFVSKLNASLSAVEYTAFFQVTSNRYSAPERFLEVAPNGDLMVAVSLEGDLGLTKGTKGPYGSRLTNTGPTHREVFVMRIGGNGGSLKFSAVIACLGPTHVSGIASDRAGNTYLATGAFGGGFPVTPGALGADAGELTRGEAFLLKLSPEGDLQFSARLGQVFHLDGGSGGPAVSVDATGYPVLWGTMLDSTARFADTAFQPANPGNRSPMILRLTPDGRDVVGGTFFGTEARDTILRAWMATDGTIHAWFMTEGRQCPTTEGAIFPQPYFGGSVFTPQYCLVQLDAAGRELLYGTYLVDQQGVLHTPFLDRTDRRYLLSIYNRWSQNRPATTPGALFPRFSTRTPVHLARLRPDGSGEELSTYLPSSQLVPLDGGRMIGLWSRNYAIPTALMPMALTRPAAEGMRPPGADPERASILLFVLDLDQPTPCHVTVSPASILIPAEGATAKLQVRTGPGCPWAMYDPREIKTGMQIQFRPETGFGNGEVEYQVGPVIDKSVNQSLMISAGASDVLFRQMGPSCEARSLAPAALTVDATGAEDTISVSVATGCRWFATSETPWIRFGAMSGPHQGVLQSVELGPRQYPVHVPPHRFQQRAATVEIAGMPLRVTQQAGPCTSTVQPSTASVPATGGAVSVDLSVTGPDCAWVAASAVEGLTVSPASGAASATLEVQVPANPTNVARTIPLFIGGSEVRISQAASPCTFRFEPPEGRIPSHEGTHSLRVVASGPGCTYIVRSQDYWIEIWQSTQSGTFTMQYTAIANISPHPRSGRISLLGTEYRVTQEAFPWLVLMDAAGYQSEPVSPGSIGTLFGARLAPAAEAAARVPLPTELQGTRISLEMQGQTWTAGLFYVSPSQINFVLPPELPFGTGTLRLSRHGESVASLAFTSEVAAPGLFSADATGSGAPAGQFVRVSAAGQTESALFRCTGNQASCEPAPIDWGSPQDEVVLVLYGTGFSGYRASVPRLLVDGEAIAAEYAGTHPSFLGLDQLNFRLPTALRGRGIREVSVEHWGKRSNRLRIHF